MRAAASTSRQMSRGGRNRQKIRDYDAASMNQPINVSDAVQRLSRVAAEFVPPARARSQNVLVPFAEVVRELREKGASFGLIVELLAGEQVRVSRFVVARFCRERLGLVADARPKRRRTKFGPRESSPPQPLVPSVVQATPSTQSVLGALSPPAPPSHGAPHVRGPRIADPRNL
jgi:hypothetical protein